MTKKLSRSGYRRHLARRLMLRFHMTMILLCVLLSGLGFSKLLLFAGLRPMVARYPATVGLSYLCFFVLVRIWLWYATRAGVGGGAALIVDTGGTSGQKAPTAQGSGGDGSFSFDVGDSEGAVILFVLVVALILLFGVGLYVIAQAPLILGEAALQALLAGGLVRATRKIDEPGWAGSVLRATYVPFLIVLVLGVVVGVTADSLCPEATKLLEVLRMCVFDS